MGTKEKILITDDNIEFCSNVKDILELEGFEADSVHNGIDAIKAIQKESYGLVLMDIKMPVMNGVETFKKIKLIAPETPVIMMTAYAVEDLIKEALNEGAFGAFYKPVDFKKLLASINDARQNGALIMVVDDDLELSSNISNILTEKRFRVKTAEDGETAVQISREKNIDVILLDIKLPVMNGLETYMAIREIRPDAVVILMTGYFQEMEDIVQQTLKKGAYVCLEKPLDIGYLLKVIQDSINQEK